MRGTLLICALIAGCARREEGPKHEAGATPPTSALAPASAQPPALALPTGIVRARAFAFNHDPQAKRCSSIMTRDGQLCPSARGEGVPLSRGRLEYAVVAITAPQRALDTAPWCFEPHHGIVLYDELDKPVAAVSMSFECERVAGWSTSHAGQYGTLPMSDGTEQAFRKLFCEELQLHPCRQAGDLQR